MPPIKMAEMVKARIHGSKARSLERANIVGFWVSIV